MKTTKVWFHAKRYGWGWGLPCAWQGWVVMAAFIANISLAAVIIHPASHPAAYYTDVILSVMVLIAIGFWKGEKPRWRWGGDGKADSTQQPK